MSTTNRLLSVDVFRGLTIAAMILVNYPGAYGKSYDPLEHSHWHGITPTDCIFPFFIFIVGVSIVLSFTKQIAAAKPKKEMVKKILVRGIKLYIIGLLLHYLPNFDFAHVDLFGVLQRIAFVFMTCAILYLYTGWKTHAYIFGGLLLFYWVAMCFIPTGEFGAGTMEMNQNFAFWFDRLFVSPELLGKHGWNAEGIFSTFPAIATGIAGMLSGHMIVKQKLTEKTVIWLFTAGALFVLAGSVWDWQFPINKKLWTSSYVLYTAGWASIMLAVSIWLIDFMQYKNNVVARVGLIFGSNAIAIYVIADFFQTIYKYSGFQNFVYFGLVDSGMAEKGASLVWAIISVISCFLFGYVLYRKKIFFKL